MRNIFKRTIPPISPLEHPRIKDRTFKQQEYRDKLANNLKADRALGEVGKLLAEDRLKKEQKSEEYIVVKYGFTKQWARELIKAGEWWTVARNLEKFEGLDNEIAKLLIEAGKWKVVVEYIKHFEGLDNEIAKLLIEAGEWWTVARNLEKFEGLDKEIAKMLIEAGRWWTVARNLEKFEWVDHNEIAKLLIELGYADEIRRSIKSSEQSEV